MKERRISLCYPLLSLVITAIIVVFSITNGGCKDPYDYEPPQDSLIQPPDPPYLIWPLDDTCYWLSDPFDYQYVVFQWSTIPNAEYYEIEFLKTWDSGSSVWSQLTPYDTITFVFQADSVYTVTYAWYVRAASDLWTWWTAWSQERTFVIPWAGSTSTYCKLPDNPFFYLENK